MELKLGLNHKHVAMARHMALHPDQKLYEVAEVFGVTKEYVSMLRRSDAFKALLIAEGNELHSEDVKKRHERVQGKIFDNLESALARVAEEIDDTDNKLSDINRTMEILGGMTSLKNNGKGTAVQDGLQGPTFMPIQINVLNEARENLINGPTKIPSLRGGSESENVCEAGIPEEEEESEALPEYEAGERF